MTAKSSDGIVRAGRSAGRRARAIAQLPSRLLPAVVITVVLGALLATVFIFFFTWVVLKVPPNGTLPAPGENGSSPFLDVLKVALTVVAGIGGAVALVVAYRRQRLTERDDAGRRARYTSAAQQLGDPQPAVRLAGVYAMAHLADEWAEQRQQCVDVLCAYLRLPWVPADSQYLEPTSTTTEQTWPAGDGQHKVTKTYSGRSGEREVRATILRVLAEHLRSTAGGVQRGPWTNLDIDLTHATLPQVDFTNTIFGRRLLLSGARFLSGANFASARFLSGAQFDGAQFSGTALFDGSQFFRKALFDGAQFSGTAFFEGVQFSANAMFDWAKFSRNAEFGGAQFAGYAGFVSAQFSGNALFSGARFSDSAGFSGARFAGNAGFVRAQFSRSAGFGGAQFAGYAAFVRAQFSGDAGFGRARFSGNAMFGGARFSGDVMFGGAGFASRVSLNAARLPSRSVFADVATPLPDDVLDQAVYADEAAP